MIFALFLMDLAIAAQPAFEAVSVKPSHPSADESTRAFDITPTSLRMRQQNLRTIVEWAYDIGDSRELSGPDWTGSDEFDIVAKSASPVTTSDMRLMMQAILRIRFQLAVHTENRSRSIYALTVAAGGPTLRKSDQPISERFKTWIGPGEIGFVHTPMTMAMLAKAIAARGAVDRPVVDETGVTGTYDIDLHFACEITAQPGEVFRGCGSDSAGNSAHPSVFRALEQQLGLKLVSKKAPVEVLVIDHVARVPSEN